MIKMMSWGNFTPGNDESGMEERLTFGKNEF